MSKAAESSLTTGERKNLAALEETIERGMSSFVDVGNALLEIQRRGLYTDVGKTFEEYCLKRWSISRSYAYRLIDSAKVVAMLEMSPIGDTGVPQNESQARVLAALPDEPTIATVWAKAIETAPRWKDGALKMSAAYLSKIAKEVTGKGKPPENSPMGDIEPTPEPLPTLDKLGNVVPEHLVEAAADPFFDETIKLLNDLAVRVKSKSNGPLGTYLLTAKVTEGLQQARNMMVNAKFHALCPSCKGKKKGCKECRTSGFVTAWRLEEIQSY